MNPYLFELEISGPIAFWARPDRRRSSANLQSAVSRICHPQRSRRFEAVDLPDTLPNAIRRYSRLQICATAKRPAHMDVFHRRLERGRWFFTPCLGWSEFVPDYAGPFRDGTAPCATENRVIPALLEMVFDRQKDEMT